MATYKLIQDIEAEDHILGPLSLRQFIFALIAAFLIYICYFVTIKGAPFLLVIFLPPTLFCAFFAVPFGRDQPTEIWALAKLRFWFRPRNRIWDQAGIKELVTITVPKRIEPVLTNGLSQTEVTSRLRALANTIDTRGWAVKNVDYDTYAPPITAGASAERLIDISNGPQEVPNYDVYAADDVLDANNNPIARQFDDMINQANQNRRQAMIDRLNQEMSAQPPAASAPAQPADDTGWFTGQAAGPGTATTVAANADVTDYSSSGATDAGSSEDEAALAASLSSRASSRKTSLSSMRTLRPTAAQPTQAPSVDASDASTSTTVTTPSDPAIMALAKNDDLNVSTLAREAHKARGGGDQGEVVVSLH